MTIEEKAKAYDEALERAKAYHRNELAGSRKEMTEYIFPELRESEDEKMMKNIRLALLSVEDAFWRTHELTAKEAISYLEKQKEQKHPNGCFTCDEYKKGYEEGRRNGFTAGYNKAMKEVEQKEQKPADDKAFEEWIDDWWKHNKVNNPDSYDNGDEIQFNEREFKNFCRGIRNMYQQKPAWSENKFPKDIEADAVQFCFDNGINITPHQAKQIATHYLMVGHNEGYLEGRKNAHIPARELGLPSSCDFQQEQKSEQYSPLCNTVKDKIREYIANHFVADTVVKTDVKSIVKAMEEGVRLGKEEQKPAEWSEEDTLMLTAIIQTLERFGGRGTTGMQIDWLKSIRPSWKPSESQMYALKVALETFRVRNSDNISVSNDKVFTQLESLYEQLKKLWL